MARRQAAIKRRLQELATPALTDLLIVDPDPDVEGDEGRTETFTVAYTWPGELVQAPTFFLGRTEGRAERESLGPDGLATDRFSIQGHIAVPGFAVSDLGGQQAEEAAERALNALVDVINETRRLTHPDIESAMSPSQFDVAWCSVSDGELYHGLPEPRAASYSGGVTFTIECAYLTR